MNQHILRNIETFLQLLKTANSDDVSKWDEGAIRKAMQWSNYAEQLYLKVCHKPEALEELNKAVKQIQRQLQGNHGNQQITVDDLKVSRTLLMKMLLQNSSLPPQLYLQLLPTGPVEKQFMAKGGNGALELDEFVKFTRECASLKLTCKVLTKIDECLDVSATSDNVAVLTDARMLRGHLLLSFNNEKTILESKERCDSLLHVIAAKPGGLEVIGSILGLEPPDTDEEASHVHVLEQFVFDWLMENKHQYISQTAKD